MNMQSMQSTICHFRLPFLMEYVITKVRNSDTHGCVLNDPLKIIISNEIHEDDSQVLHLILGDEPFLN